MPLPRRDRARTTSKKRRWGSYTFNDISSWLLFAGYIVGYRFPSNWD